MKKFLQSLFISLMAVITAIIVVPLIKSDTVIDNKNYNGYFAVKDEDFLISKGFDYIDGAYVIPYDDFIEPDTYEYYIFDQPMPYYYGDIVDVGFIFSLIFNGYSLDISFVCSNVLSDIVVLYLDLLIFGVSNYA